MPNFVFFYLFVALIVARTRAQITENVSGSTMLPCDSECRVSVRSSGTNSNYSSASCILHTDTPTCNTLSLKYDFNRRCTDAELDVLISSRAWHDPPSNMCGDLFKNAYRFDNVRCRESHVLVNVTIKVYEEVKAAYLELECLHAPEVTDAYCHDHRRPEDWGRMIWPCRKFDLHKLLDKGDVELRVRSFIVPFASLALSITMRNWPTLL